MESTHSWIDFEGLCCKTTCRRFLRANEGIFCANYLSKRGLFAPCKSAWCGPCYGPRGSKPFLIRAQYDDDGDIIEEPGRKIKFLEGRKGDHLMVPFQCDQCHFRNITGRDPMRWKVTDHEVLEYIRRANLDAFWDRSPNTVSSNLSDAWRMEKMGERLGLGAMAPAIGPFPLKDECGMRFAIAILERSLAPGQNEEFVQWGTFRKTRSTVTNISQAGVEGLSDSIGAYERKKLWISKVATHSFWFSRFMSGLHKRVGELRKQDEPLSIDVVHAAARILEVEWARAKTKHQKKRIAEMGVWFVAGFCSGLRGEEMILIERAGTINSLAHLEDSEPWFKFVVSGPTKGSQLSGSKFAIPIVGTTSGTHLEPGKWIKRLGGILTDEKCQSGRLFSRRLNPPRLYKFEEDFFRVLSKVQATTEFIGKEVEVTDDYGISRSSRRGISTHARNMGVSDELLHVFNRWRREMQGSGGLANLDMADTYSKLDTLVPMLLNFTRPQ